MNVVTKIYISLLFCTVSDLVWSWLKHRHGVFEEEGFPGDALYPASFLSGNATSPALNRGCQGKGGGHFCAGADVYNREAPTKQNVLCYGASALETVLADQDFKVGFF